MNKESGFTLIELLIIVALIGILSALALTSFVEYRAAAAYSVAESTVRNARTAAALGTNDLENLPAAVPSTSQSTPGGITDGLVADYLPGMQVPKDIKLTVTYDPTCIIAACQREEIQAQHCKGTKYTRWVRFGDETDVLLEALPGAGCS